MIGNQPLFALAAHANPLAKPANKNFSKSFGINNSVRRHYLLGRRNMLPVRRITGPALRSELIYMPLTKEG
jgi:hypothetical protein